MSTFITRFETEGRGIRLAVKDIIDMAGVPTTAGSAALADIARPAAADAACLAGARAAGARIVGRTNLHELALGVTGINPWFGTPVNPLGAGLVPGGSSSGSAVAVAAGDADVAYGTDTGGSVRIPAACCGVAGLKTTWGRIPLDGVWPLSPSFDTVGPLAADVAGLVTGMALLEPGFAAEAPAPVRVGRFHLPCDAVVDEAVDAALAATGWEVVDVELPGWASATGATALLLVHEAWGSDRALAEAHPERIGADVLARLLQGRDADPAALAAAAQERRRWTSELDALFARVDLLATPTLTVLTPPIEQAEQLLRTRCTLPVNLAGVPALSLPVPSRGGLPASVQLVGPGRSEERLLAAGAVLEAAAGWRR